MASNGQSHDAEKINTDIITLTRFLTEEQTKHKEATGDFTYATFPSQGADNGLTSVDFFAMPYNSHSRALPTTFGEQH